MKENEFIKAIKDKYFGGSSNPIVILLIIVIAIVLIFLTGLFTFINEKELYPTIVEWMSSQFGDESTTNETTDNQTTERATTKETTIPQTTVVTTHSETDIVTTYKPIYFKDITQEFINDNQVIYCFEPRISGEHWFGIDISTVKSRYIIEIYNQKDEQIKQAYSYDDGFSVNLNEGEEYRLIISPDTDNYPFKAFVEINEPNVTQVIEVN